MTATETKPVTVEIAKVERFQCGKWPATDIICDVSYYGTRARVEAYIRRGELRIDELCRDIHYQLAPVLGRMDDDEVTEVFNAIEAAISLGVR